MDQRWQKTIDIGSIVLCIILLILQGTLLNIFCIKYCTDEGNRLGSIEGYIWFIADIFTAIVWIFGFYKARKHFHKQLITDETDFPDSNDLTKLLKAAINELPYAYISWCLYAVIIIVKIVIMFDEFAEALRGSGGFYTSTTLKLVLSISGPIFLCLAFGHHNERNTDYKLRIDRLGYQSALGILDSLILLNNLFVYETELFLTFPLDHAIKAVTCINYLLPVISLLLLRILTQNKYSKYKKKINFVVIVSSIQTFLVDVPLFGIRLYLWYHHDVDVSIFLTKNIMSFVNAGVESACVVSSIVSSIPVVEENEMEALEQSSMITREIPLSESATLPMKI